ncbi:hypothetical protein ABBQ38_014113 [Trebouxia sp. C0009 RCD-2024]
MSFYATSLQAMPPAIDVTVLKVAPNHCPLGDPLTLEMTFVTDQAMHQVYWEVQYMVDMTLQRHVLHLGSTQHQEYPAGMCSTQFAVPKIDLDGLKKSWLNNVGLLLVLLKDKSGEQILQVSMVTQIELQSGIPIRHMLSPLD